MGTVDGFFDVVHRQRACRAYGDVAVDDATVERVLEAATFAPSAENRQPWVFVVVRDAQRRASIGALTRQAWEAGGRAHSEGRLTPALLADVEGGAQGGVAGAPVLVVVCGDAGKALGDSIYEARIFVRGKADDSSGQLRAAREASQSDAEDRPHRRAHRLAPVGIC